MPDESVPLTSRLIERGQHIQIRLPLLGLGGPSLRHARGALLQQPPDAPVFGDAGPDVAFFDVPPERRPEAVARRFTLPPAPLRSDERPFFKAVVPPPAARSIFVGASAGGSISGNTIANGGTTGIDVRAVGGRLLVTGNTVDSTTPFSTSGTNNGLRVVENVWSTTIIRELTIAAGVVTAYLEWHTIDTEADAATDDLNTINGGTDGGVVTFRASSGARDVVFKDSTGNLQLAGDFTLNNTQDTITLRYMGGTWYELSRSDNGA